MLKALNSVLPLKQLCHYSLARYRKKIYVKAEHAEKNVTSEDIQLLNAIVFSVSEFNFAKSDDSLAIEEAFADHMGRSGEKELPSLDKSMMIVGEKQDNWNRLPIKLEFWH